ncbi:MAG: amidohydrolase family protein [archaeon]|nr:amidohydrolase family protein [archaeon]
MYDKLVLNSRIYSLDREGEYYNAMAIDNGKIVKLYDKEPLNANSISKEVVDAQNKIILPGFIDSHFHFLMTAPIQSISLPISEIKGGKMYPDSLDMLRDKLQEFSKKIGPKKPIFCSGFGVAAIKENRFPTWKELDAWVPNKDVIITSMDGHSGAFSSNALKKMGFDPSQHDGFLTGKEYEYNTDKMKSIIIRSLRPGMLLEGIQSVINDAINHGIVGIYALEGFSQSQKDIMLWMMSIYAGILPLQIWMTGQIRSLEGMKKYSKSMSYPRIGGCGPWEMDGAVGSHTAAYFESYLDNSENFGAILYPYEELIDNVIKAHDFGFQITSHAIGTKGIEHILQAYEELFRKRGLSENIRRHRIDHFEFPNIEQVERTLKLGILVVPQPGYAWMDKHYLHSYERNLRPEQIARQIPLKTIADAGGYILGSADSPVQHLNPFTQIMGMVNFPIEKEQLSVYQALRTYTYNGAYGTFEENVRGTLTVGKYADFIMLEEDPFKISKNNLADIKVKSTYIKGFIQQPMDISALGLIFKGIFGKKKKI